MNIDDLLNDPPKLHSFRGELLSSWKLADEELRYLDRTVDSSMRTIETGAGLSTVVFAAKGSRHTCIVPDAGLADRIRAFCEAQAIDHSGVEFILQPSEYALPRLEGGDYDLALIDGRHGFPTPFLDWFYLANLLKIGGIVIVDDLHIWTCEVLAEFLHLDGGWALVEESLGAAIFRKLSDATRGDEFSEQPFVIRQSRSDSLSAKNRYMLNLLKRRNFRLFGSTFWLGVESALAGRFGKRPRR